MRVDHADRGAYLSKYSVVLGHRPDVLVNRSAITRREGTALALVHTRHDPEQMWLTWP